MSSKFRIWPGSCSADFSVTPIQKLLARIRHDPKFGQGLFELGYLVAVIGEIQTSEGRVLRRPSESGLDRHAGSTRHGRVRFTIRGNAKGQWFEIGEMTHDGQTWRQFFEMTPDRHEGDNRSEQEKPGSSSLGNGSTS
jgi:hypothetical protein